MQNSSVDFKKTLDQSLYTYMPDKISGLEDKKPTVSTGIPKIAKNLKPVKLGLVSRLRPVVEYTAITEVIVGVTLMILLLLNGSDYDKLYGTERSGLISLMTLGGSFLLIFNAIILMTSLKWNKKKVMWSYILMSTMLWVYLFVLSVMKIHYALLVIERDTYKVVLPQRHIFLSNACSLGVATLLGSGNKVTQTPLKTEDPSTRLVLYLVGNCALMVILGWLCTMTHFIGNVAVFTYYNLKYIQPMLFSCGP